MKAVDKFKEQQRTLYSVAVIERVTHVKILWRMAATGS
jgi:hypothetical protein